GDLAKQVLSYIPRSRVKDTIYFNPAETPIGINFLSYSSEMERNVIADDLFIIFHRLTEGGGPRMDAILKRAIELLLAIPGNTFFDLYRIFTDDMFLHSLVRQLPDDSAKKFWKETWPKYPHPVTEEPIVTRMSQFDTSKALRQITSSNSGLNFYDVLQSGKIFIAALPKGEIGSDTSSMLGALLVSQMQLAAFRRVKLPRKERRPFYLFIDEFQNFKTSAFNDIVIEARKFQLCLTLATVKTRDLDEQTRSAMEAVETYIFFRLMDDDARKFGGSLGGFNAESLMNLHPHHAIIRRGRAADTATFKVSPPPRPKESFADEIILQTREMYPPSVRLGLASLQGDDDDVKPGLPPE
ncbi:MAG TPA: type IV secretory system conjugative DNA transfer family protein, partial [Thermoanaerobaculia bacterium]|nr:type IV secretory system conjugative DNA transfer family protein [Thermoanaerobaculia bacterium]